MKIGCVIVLYNPSLPLLEKVVDAVEGQVEGVFFADNSDNIVIVPVTSLKVIYKKMEKNIGIAAAQNQGIRYFLDNGFTHLFFLDQDSIINPGLVQQLLHEMDSLVKERICVGGIGARPFNRVSGENYKASVKIVKQYSEYLTEVGELMNSASLISANNFKEVGLFEEFLFIDGVDHEWCWRAKSLKSYRFFISEKARNSHFLGEGDRFFLYRKVAIPTPFRVYYQYRNYLILVKRGYVPIYWKLSNGLKYFVKIFYYIFFLKADKSYFTNIIRGIKDGLLKR